MAVAQPTRKTADPRPSVIDGPAGPVVAGARCLACGHPSAWRVPRCPRCAGETGEARFGPDGVIWATTTIHIASGDREAPYTLAYVDLEDGPRVLAHVHDGPAAPPHVAQRVRLIGQTPQGDPDVQVISERRGGRSRPEERRPIVDRPSTARIGLGRAPNEAI